MPLPMPRWVMSSPSHMTSAVPAVHVRTISAARAGVEVGDHVGALEARRSRGGRCLPSCSANTKPVDWMSAEADGDVAGPLRDLLLPDLALFCHCSSFGITTPSSCMMIDAVMYGMIPRKKIATLVIAPPEKRSRKPTTPPLVALSWSFLIARSRRTEPAGGRPPGRPR